MALSFLRKVHGAAAKGNISEVQGGLPLEVAYYLLNRKKRELAQIENDYDIEVTVKGKTSYLLNQMELEVVKREKPHLEDVLKSEAEAEEAHKPAPVQEKLAITEAEADQPTEGGEPAEGGKKRKRRRKKKKHAGDITPPVENIETAETEEHAVAGAQTELHAVDPIEFNVESGQAEAEGAAKHKKRRRRRARKGGKEQEETSPAIDGVTAEVAPLPAAAVTEPSPTEAPVPAVKPKRPRPPRARKKPAVAAAEPVHEKPMIEAIQVTEVAPPPMPKTRRVSTPKKIKVVVPPPPKTAEEKTKPAPRARRKKKEEDIQ